MKTWEPGALRDWATLALILGTATAAGYLLILDWPLVAAFLGARPWLVFWGFVSSLSILGALFIWTALTDKRGTSDNQPECCARWDNEDFH